MKKVTPSSSQTMQRVKVGMSGLAAVVLLIGLASAVFSAASRERPLSAPGAPVIDQSLNIAAVNMVDVDEPLAELGVAPSTSNAAAPAGPSK